MSQPSKLIIGYLRCSSAGQADDGTTIDRQRSMIQSYSQLKGIGEARFIADEAVSGAKENRAGLSELLVLVNTGKVSTVVVADLSRLSRNVKHTLELIDLFTKHGVTFVSLNEDIKTDTAMGKFFLTLCSAFNQMYRDSIADRMKTTWHHKRLKNEKCSGTVPYGYTVVGKQLIPNEQEQSIIRLILTLKKLGKTFYEIARHLDSQGVKTKTGKGTWNHRIICNIVRRESAKQQPDKAA